MTGYFYEKNNLTFIHPIHHFIRLRRIWLNLHERAIIHIYHTGGDKNAEACIHYRTSNQAWD